MRILLPVMALLYVLSPYDLVPDFFVGPGWIDDIIVLCGLWWYVSSLRRSRAGARKGNSGSPRGSFAGQGGEAPGGRSEAFNARRPPLPHEVLGVHRDASREEIRTAYRVLAAKYHPDKVMHLGEEFRELAEIRFKEIQEAYRTMLNE